MARIIARSTLWDGSSGEWDRIDGAGAPDDRQQRVSGTADVRGSGPQPAQGEAVEQRDDRARMPGRVGDPERLEAGGGQVLIGLEAAPRCFVERRVAGSAGVELDLDHAPHAIAGLAHHPFDLDLDFTE